MKGEQGDNISSSTPISNEEDVSNDNDQIGQNLESNSNENLKQNDDRKQMEQQQLHLQNETDSLQDQKEEVSNFVFLFTNFEYVKQREL
jgi:hypothetical protein